MDLDRIPGWFKALAASLWVIFVFAPLIIWLTHHFGDAAIWAVLPALAAAFCVFYRRASDEDISDAEYYRRKARSRKAVAE
jgi:peptidoglycan/LPS O-acetylase OafA/YrhL